MDTKEIELVALRFRDLLTTSGDTIRLHQKLAANDLGYVWWGWWNKSGEAVPGAVFRALSERIHLESQIKIILFDSGHQQIRYAYCSSIQWDPRYQPIPSPEREQTPAYYRDQLYLAWFRFVKIDEPVENPDKELTNYTYLGIDEFFKNQKSRYSHFYGKRVADCDELTQQDRTMWFLRTTREGDPVHKVSLLQNSQLRPHHFTETYVASKSRHLLWVSDLHFGTHHGFPNTSDEVTCDLSQAIETAAKKHNIEDFAGVIVSGDITWGAAQSEFNDAVNFFQKISRSSTALDNYRFAICPGNHDLAFTDTPAKKTAAIHHSTAPRNARRNYEEFYEKLFYIKPNEYLSIGRRFLLGGHFPLELICLNSSLLEQKSGWFQGHGFIGERQLEQVEHAFEWHTTQLDCAALPRPFRVVVMHHHLLPVTYAEEPKGGISFSTVLDAERVARWLARHRVDVLLHGHMHQPYYARLTKPIDVKKPDGDCHSFHIIGLGSTGVERNHRGEFGNMFGVLSATTNAVQVSIYEVTPGAAEQTKVWGVTIPLPHQEVFCAQSDQISRLRYR